MELHVYFCGLAYGPTPKIKRNNNTGNQTFKNVISLNKLVLVGELRFHLKMGPALNLHNYL